MNTKRIIIAAVVGAGLGIVTEFIVRPYIEKPLEKEVAKVITGDESNK